MSNPSVITAAQLALINEAKKQEDEKYLDDRNRLTMTLWNSKGGRDLRFDCPKGQAYRVETWWDNQSRNYITQTFALIADNQWDPCTTECDYTGHKTDAAIAHFWAICKILFPTKS